MAAMEKQQDTQDDFREKRASPRTLVECYYSVQFAISKESPAYQFKLRDISDGGLCIAIRQDSAILAHIKVGETHRMSYAPLNAPRLLKNILTEIRHITFCREGPHKDHYLVGLSIVENEKSV